jgi:hypothetical protein
MPGSAELYLLGTFYSHLTFVIGHEFFALLQELRVATCLELLGTDGYLKIGFDGPDMEEEVVPLHCTSPLLFPVGYGSEYGISIRGPSGWQ